MFSVVIPLFNKRKTIVGTLNSVLNQSFADFEIVVVDDGSTDGSADAVRAVEDERIKLYSIPNSGPSAARNYGVEKASGEWVVFLDADDIMLHGALARFAGLSNKYPETDVFAGNHSLSKDGNEYLYSKRYSERMLANPYREWFFGRFMPCAGTCAYKRKVLLSHPFNPALRRYEDAAGCFDIMRSCRIYRFPEPVMLYNRDESSSSRRRDDISEDFLGHLDLSGKGFWEKMNLYEFYVQAKNLYPSESRELYPDLEKRHFFLKIGYHFMFWLRYLEKLCQPSQH